MYGMSNIGPQHAVLNSQITRIPPIPPTVIVKCQTIITGTQKHIINKPILATHQIYSVTPSTIRKAFDITNNNIPAVTSHYGIMLRIKHCQSVNQNMSGTGNLNSPQGLEQIPAPYNPHILDPIKLQLGFQQCSRCQIDSTITRYTDFIIRKILWLMNSRTKINQLAILAENILCTIIPYNYILIGFAIIYLLLYHVGKNMKIMKSVAIKFYTELPWLIQYEFNLILTNTFSGYLMYGRTNKHI